MIIHSSHHLFLAE